MEFFAVERGSAPAGHSLRNWTLGSLVLLLAWEASGLDLPLARLVASGGQGFSGRDSWIAGVLLHDGMRHLAFAAGAWLLAGVWWPTGVLRRLSRDARIQWLASLVLGVALVNLLKHTSHTSCPWDLAEFGGASTYVQHWIWRRADGGPGHCFPAGHASAAFAFVGGFFVLRPLSARLAARCLGLVLALGLALGLVQQFRGAHFMSHTLWTAWLCWVAAWGVDAVARVAQGRRACLS
jgi:membrane-associated PAP2 superfamily phosphatase